MKKVLLINGTPRANGETRTALSIIETAQQEKGIGSEWFRQHGVQRIFAYNACFDRNHLPELHGFDWYDIMRLAAYRQHNHKIPADAACCSTGRLKRGYGVEPMLRLLSGDRTYQETHNAMFDAVDELKIMWLMKRRVNDYISL